MGKTGNRGDGEVKWIEVGSGYLLAGCLTGREFAEFVLFRDEKKTGHGWRGMLFCICRF